MKLLPACVLAACLGNALPARAQEKPVEPPPNPAIVATEWIFEEPPVPQCHASSIVAVKDGLVAAWFAGTAEGKPDVGIWVSRKVDGAWTAPKEVLNGIQEQDGKTVRHPCWNPVLFRPSHGPLLLFCKIGPSPSTWWGVLLKSDDQGKTWSAPERLPDGFAGPIKNKPVELADGVILCGSSTEHAGWKIHFERTADLGKTWTKAEPPASKERLDAIQPSILVHTDGTLQSLGRSRQGKLWTTRSTDQGKTWSALEMLAVPNPNSGTDAVTLQDGRHILVYNNTPKGRSPLNAAISTDGTHWQDVAVLENKPGEYSYPAVIQGPDGLVHITYTWQRKKIRHVTLDPAKFLSTSAPEGTR